jgi:hypothetical protein
MKKPQLNAIWNSIITKPRSCTKKRSAAAAGVGASPTPAANPERIRAARRLLNDVDLKLQTFVAMRRSMAMRYTGRFPITRIRGTQNRLLTPSMRVLKHSRYDVRALLV